MSDTEQPLPPTKTCFVVMGFGKKTDFESGRTLDLDKTYRSVVKPAVEAAGLACVRADEIVHSGLIDIPMYEQLLNADVVVADLSTSNKNALYELGVRHALRPFTTLVIAEDGIKAFPFDVNRVRIRQYHHLGEDIGFDEVMRFRKELTDAVVELMKDPRRKDSPIYTLFGELEPPGLAKTAQASSEGAVGVSPPPVAAGDATSEGPSPHSILMRQVDQAQKAGDFVTAKGLLTAIREMMQEPDSYIVQRSAFVTYMSKSPSPEAALVEARGLLLTLDPETSNDPETLGLWGAVHKRLWDLNGREADLDAAIRAYEQGFYLRNDHYNGINLAYLFNVRASVSGDTAEAVADVVNARRVRKEVLVLCNRWLDSHPLQSGAAADRYWVLATRGEAYAGLEDRERATSALAEAYAMAPEGWMVKSTSEQVDRLEKLIANSPLERLRFDAGEV